MNELEKLARLGSIMRKCDADVSCRQLLLLTHLRLRELRRMNVASVRELEKDTKLSKPAITRAWQKLQDCGYVRHRRDPSDHRLVQIRISAEGIQFLEHLLAS